MSSVRDSHESFLVYKHGRYFWYAVLLSLAAVFGYVSYHGMQPANGGTWLGYTLGSAAAFIIVVLMCFGIRKRKYRSQTGTLQGWLSVHVYFGVSLLLLATLHTGFQLGWNIHSLCYWLLWVLVISGILVPMPIIVIQGLFCR